MFAVNMFIHTFDRWKNAFSNSFTGSGEFLSLNQIKKTRIAAGSKAVKITVNDEFIYTEAFMNLI